MLNERQDYFGQTVNIAARVQGLATSQAIHATGGVVDRKTLLTEFNLPTTLYLNTNIIRVVCARVAQRVTDSEVHSLDRE
jgi:class 3 adenylate cyclase